MALTHVGASAPVFAGGVANPSVTPTVPAGTTEGDHAFLFVVAKWVARDLDPAGYTGWTLLADVLVPTSTSGNNSAGAGQVRTGVLYRRVPSGGLTAPTVTFTGTGTAAGQISGATISVWRSDTGADITTAAAVGYDTSTTTAFSFAAGTDPGYVSGDGVLLLSALTDDAPRYSTSGLTAAGATISALTEVADVGSATGDDVGVGVFTGTVTAGASTAAPVFAGTMSVGAGSLGGTHFVRLREAAGAPVTVTGTGALAATAPALAGAAVLRLSGVGTLAVTAPTLAGTASVTGPVAGTGDLTPAGAVLSGAGTARLTGTGVLTPTAAALSGAGTARLTGVGVLAATAAALSGAGSLTVTGAGALAPAADALSGAGIVAIPAPDAITGAGVLAAASPALSGAGTARLTGTGILAPAAAALSGPATVRLAGAGTLTAPAAAALSGTAAVRLTGIGILAPAAAILSGSGLLSLTGAGVLDAAPAALAGAGLVLDPDYVPVVAGQSHTVTVPAESRTVRVPAESRTVRVPAEFRSATVRGVR